MINLRRMEKQAAANARVELLFYEVVEKNGKKLMKPLKLNTSVPVSVVKAVLDRTIVDSFYQRLASDLLARGVKAGKIVQVRADFSKSEGIFEDNFKGTKVLCEVKVQ